MSRTRRLPTPAGPAEQGFHGDLAYTLWLPKGEPWGGMVVIHGAELVQGEPPRHGARRPRGGPCGGRFDLRGHGETGGAIDARMLEDIAAIASLLPRPLALRGSSSAATWPSRRPSGPAPARSSPSARLAAGYRPPRRLFPATSSRAALSPSTTSG